jgi:hypothetical protein
MIAVYCAGYATSSAKFSKATAMLLQITQTGLAIYSLAHNSGNAAAASTATVQTGYVF